jgi:hypothetical protein
MRKFSEVRVLFILQEPVDPQVNAFSISGAASPILIPHGQIVA